MKNIILIIIFCLISSCVYQSYAGRYWIGKQSASFISHPASKETNEKIEAIVRGIANDFGFIEQKRFSWAADNVVSFGKSRKKQSRFDNLDGAKSGIVLQVVKGPQPEIGIKDYDNTYETEFIKALKKELKNRLNKVVDMNGVEFKRVIDMS